MDFLLLVNVVGVFSPVASLCRGLGSLGLSSVFH